MLKRFWFWRNYSTKQWSEWWNKRDKDWQKEHLSTFT